jgi:hypothetical protein
MEASFWVLVHRSAIAQAEELLGRQQRSLRACARGVQDLLAHLLL